MLKIGVIDYCATGEGRHIIIKTGSEESIKESVGDWLYQGAEVYTAEQWMELSKKATGNDNKQNANVEILKVFAPALWDAMNRGVSVLVDIEYYWNES
ncbi:hypothetical protein F0241_11520 [Vibrio kanaloae]|uniref:hypothetical protein n=1 Tax=Vibrio kanaloae TaxID=170673 RepID=UPI00148B5EE5|nr:hypothetical protein [Vibrio kanaloae]NOI01742.1 hypothetical protein [Vibrio kanaloae]